MKQPKIRFKGFSGEWKTSRLDACVDFLDNLRQPIDAKRRIKGIYPYYGASGIVDYVHDYIFDEELILLSEDGANITDRTYPVCFLAKGKYWVNNHAHVLKSKEGFVNAFISNAMEHKDYSLYNTGMAMPKLNKEVCKRIPLTYPSKEEQQDISDYFQYLDSLILSTAKKIESLKQVKAASLQSMFPQEGETTPRVRFKGFGGEWKLVAIKDIAVINPKTNIPNTFEYVDLESVVGTEMKFHRTETKQTAPSRAQRKATRGDIFYQTVRPYQKNNYYFDRNEDNFVFSSGYAQIRAEQCGAFLFALMQQESFVQKVMDNCTGTSFPAINANVLGTLKIMVTNSEKEQQMIASYFTTLDSQISFQTQRLEKLKQIKSACLDNMFV